MRFIVLWSNLGMCALLTLGLAADAQEGASHYLSVEQIRPGMTGYGKTVFQGTEIQRFDVAILGILKNYYPGQDLILAKCSGAPLEDTGVIQGMSGSPIYIDGKLIGALAYAWAFANEALAGITPIHNMLAIPERKDKPPDRSAFLWDVRRAEHTVPALSSGIQLKALKLPVTVSNISPPVLDVLSRELAPMGMVPVQGGGMAARGADVPCEPGGVMGVVLITGDMDMSGIGTITERIGDKVYGFGHPMFAEGNVDLPLSSGLVHTVVSSRQMSFKIASPVRLIGRISSDRHAGIAGTLGVMARMIDLELNIQREGQTQNQHLSFHVANHPRFTPILVGIACLESILFRGSLPDENTISYKMTFHADGVPPLSVANIESGIYSLPSFYHELRSPIADLLDNRFRDVPISGIDVDVQVKEGDRSARIDGVASSMVEVEPGQKIELKIRLTPYRGKKVWQRIHVQIPSNTPDGPLLVICCGADESRMLDRMEGPHKWEPRDFDAMLDEYRKRPSRNHIMVRLRAQDHSVAVDGTELHGLPPSILGVFQSSSGSMSFPIPRTRISRHETDRVIFGFATTILHVKRKD